MKQSLQEFKAELFKALSSPVRIRILEELRIHGVLTVGQIQQLVQLEPSNVSQHLSILRRHGLVVGSRDGTNVRYAVSDPDIYGLLDVARSVFEKQLIDRSRLLVENQ